MCGYRRVGGECSVADSEDWFLVSIKKDTNYALEVRRPSMKL